MRINDFFIATDPLTDAIAIDAIAELADVLQVILTRLEVVAIAIDRNVRAESGT